MKTHKRKKSSRMHGHGMGTHGWGSRKQHRSHGNQGGRGMAGSGKRADHKKSKLTTLYGNSYFGKQGITSRGTKRDTRKRINLKNIELNPEKYGKKTSKGYEINLKDYKILGQSLSEDGKLKHKLIIHAKEASVSAIEKVEAAGGEMVLPKSKESKEESEDEEEE